MHSRNMLHDRLLHTANNYNNISVNPSDVKKNSQEAQKIYCCVCKKEIEFYYSIPGNEGFFCGVICERIKTIDKYTKNI